MNIPKLVFIIPFRDRYQYKLHFEIYMKYIMEDYDKKDFEIYFVHQCDKRKFNRGAMKNIGFLAIKKKYPNNYKNITFVFNDIDTLPYKKNLLNYETTIGTIKHFFGYVYTLGGIFSITGHDFESIGGFPNIWSWGFEDNTLNDRALNKKIIIDRSNFYKPFSHEIIHINDNLIRELSKETPWRYRQKNLDNMYDIKNINYEFNNEYINVKSFDTKIDSSKDTYYYEKDRAKIYLDRNYNPKGIKIKNTMMQFINK